MEGDFLKIKHLAGFGKWRGSGGGGGGVGSGGGRLWVKGWN